MKVNIPSSELLKLAGKEDECCLIDGILYSWTGEHTGRSPNAKAFELDAFSENLDWSNNRSVTSEEFTQKWEYFNDHFKSLQSSSSVYLQKVTAVRDPSRKVKVDIYTETAKHALFCRNMFVPDDSADVNDEGQLSVYHFPSLLKEPTVLISLSRKIILISGTLYAGEIKKSVFTVLNWLFPLKGELPMHCSVNVDKNREHPTVFFGLSGTGKTTLSSDPNRILIGDDEHAWTHAGLTNFEGGCYAKTIKLSKEDEPEIWNACFSEGTILENVVLKDGMPDFDDNQFTENGRASYSTTSIPNADDLGYVNRHPKNIVMLTCDAFGVLPPVSKLSSKEAVKQFTLGYTAKVAGTEAGITEPVATFSPCFGGPFMPLPVKVYADILEQKIEEHDVQCWLVNTGWTAGPYGVGKRISIKVTRAIIDSILDGSLATVRTITHRATGLNIPSHPDIPFNVLVPESGWDDKILYNQKVKELLDLFQQQEKKVINATK
ncbi:phosphoenolpyruvate carboxykinase (ATP) [bacterium]|nr:phosphoenolpyruvate carboxykinase (ATP) [bacterium]